MKKQICVNVDMDSWLIAKQKIPNISEYLSECLKGLTGKTKEEISEAAIKEEIGAINNSLQELNIKKSIREMQLKQLIEVKLEKDKELKALEAYKRWECPICHKPKTLETTYCETCGLNTKPKDESKIKYIYLEAR